MSNYYDLYCRTCDVRAGAFHWNHGERSLRELSTRIVEIKGLYKLRDVLAEADITVRLESGAEWTNWSAFVDFIDKHGDHAVRVRSEYGDVDGNCNVRFQCSDCQHSQLCVLPEGHATPHRGHE